MLAVARRLSDLPDPGPHRIGMRRVVEIGSAVTLSDQPGAPGDSQRDDSQRDIAPLETWLCRHVISRIPDRLLVSPHRTGSLLGFHRRAQQGPKLIAAIVGLLHGRPFYVPASAVPWSEIAGTTGAIRLKPEIPGNESPRRGQRH